MTQFNTNSHKEFRTVDLPFFTSFYYFGISSFSQSVSLSVIDDEAWNLLFDNKKDMTRDLLDAMKLLQQNSVMEILEF